MENKKQIDCKFCMKNHPFGRNHCPAWGKRCNNCMKMNHFGTSPVCRKKNIREVEENKTAAAVNSLFLGSVEHHNTVEISQITEDWQITVNMKKGPITFKIDTGADVTVIDPKHLHIMDKTIADIIPTKQNLSGPSKQQLECLGYTNVTFNWKGRTTQQRVYVCQNISKSLLGKPAIRELQLVNPPRHHEGDVQCNEIMSVGLGCITGEPVKIELCDGAVPYHLNAPGRAALPLLQRMLALGVIRKVNQPT